MRGRHRRAADGLVAGGVEDVVGGRERGAEDVDPGGPEVDGCRAVVAEDRARVGVIRGGDGDEIGVVVARWVMRSGIVVHTLVARGGDNHRVEGAGGGYRALQRR